jgi:hypothetical protein
MSFSVHILRLLSRQSKSGAPAVFLLGGLISLYAALPRVIWDRWDYLFFPLTWLWEVGATLAAVWLGVIFLPMQIKTVIVRIIKPLSCGFAFGYIALMIAGFDWTGYLMRFSLFQFGLRDEVRMHIKGSHDWNVYYWGTSDVGGENDYYLISDPSDRLSGVKAGEQALGMTCPLVVNRLLWPSWRLVITDNCYFE